VERRFSLEEASALLPEARRRIAEVARMSAELQRLALTIQRGEHDPGAIPEAKALEARTDDRLSWFREQGILVKGVAPALLDFPARGHVDGEERDVLLCWREGEDEIAFFHPPDTGYLGRAPLTDLDPL
jgi:hypothetical protein